MTLYEIDEAILNCITVDEETGEATADEDRIAELQMERDSKIEGVVCWIKNLMAENDAISVEQKRLAERKKKNEKLIEQLKHFLMWALNGQKFATGKCAVAWRKSESVEIEEGTELPEEYMAMKVESSPNKTALKTALKNGVKILGVTLAERYNAQIK